MSQPSNNELKKKYENLSPEQLVEEYKKRSGEVGDLHYQSEVFKARTQELLMQMQEINQEFARRQKEAAKEQADKLNREKQLNENESKKAVHLEVAAEPGPQHEDVKEATQ